jgi:hypothetical protein
MRRPALFPNGERASAERSLLSEAKALRVAARYKRLVGLRTLQQLARVGSRGRLVFRNARLQPQPCRFPSMRLVQLADEEAARAKVRGAMLSVPVGASRSLQDEFEILSHPRFWLRRV